MAKLTHADVDRMRARYPESYVARQIEIHGLKDEKAPAPPPAPQPQFDTVPPISADQEAPDTQEESFDPKDHTAKEISDYLAANPWDRERVLALESEGRQRTGVLSF